MNLKPAQLNVNYVAACDDLGELAFIAREGGVIEEAMRRSAKFKGTPKYYETARPVILAEWRAGIELRRAERGKAGRPNGNTSQAAKNFAALLDEYKLKKDTAYRWMHMSYAPRDVVDEYFDRREAKHEPFKRSELIKIGKHHRPLDAPLIDDGYRIIHADLASAEIEEGSIDCIITDPPYPREFIGEYEKLSRFAARVLKPGGSCLAMAGQSYLPNVLAALATNLKYHWTLAYLTPGGQAVQQWERQVNTFWKPVLWFVNGELDGEWSGDVIKSDVNDNDKRFHEWGQSESGMARLVERYSRSGDLICDPFVGGGPTAIAALARGRRFIGIDKDEQAVKDTLSRIARMAATDE
jgi:site-specific DNA-methyltransferase (adenine-specific)